MKLWIAAFFATDASKRVDERAFLVRARDVSECAFVAEEHVKNNPHVVSPEYDQWVNAIIDLHQEAAGTAPEVLHGPFGDFGVNDANQTYWRRDEGDAFWVNSTEMRHKSIFECIYDDPRGWPAHVKVAAGRA